MVEAVGHRVASCADGFSYQQQLIVPGIGPAPSTASSASYSWSSLSSCLTSHAAGLNHCTARNTSASSKSHEWPPRMWASFVQQDAASAVLQIPARDDDAPHPAERGKVALVHQQPHRRCPGHIAANVLAPHPAQQPAQADKRTDVARHDDEHSRPVKPQQRQRPKGLRRPAFSGNSPCGRGIGQPLLQRRHALPQGQG